MRRAIEILEAGAQHMRDRSETYDQESGEMSIGATVNAFNAITGHALTHEQGWMFMMLLKAVRSQAGNFKLDNYEDMAAYAALCGMQAEFSD